MSTAVNLTKVRARAFLAKAFLFTALTITLALSVSETAYAQNVKMGFIDDERVMQSYEAWSKAADQFQTEVRAWEDEARSTSQAYVDDSLEYEKQKLILSAQRKAERKAEIGAKRMAHESFVATIFGPNGTAERKQAGLTKPLLENVQAAISKVAADDNYDVIFNASGLAYINPSFDITDKVIAALAEEG